MQIQTGVIGFKQSLSQASPISKRTEPAFLKPCPKVTKVISIAIELKWSRGTIELKTDGQRAQIYKKKCCFASDYSLVIK